MIRLRESFAGKILAGLLGTVGLLLVVAYAVVRFETGRQVRAVTERATVNATEQFREREEVARIQVERVAGRLTEGRRTLAALDDAIKSQDRSWIMGLADYELQLAGLPDLLLAFTDAEGLPVLTMSGPTALEESDPAGVAPVAEALMDSDAFELQSYRVVGDVLYSLRTRVIELAGRPIGTLSLGLPITDEDVSVVGGLIGVEVCFVVAERCVAGTSKARQGLSDVLVAEAGLGDPMRVEALGSTWSVRAQPLVVDDPSQGWSVVAVPLDVVVAPFERITRALFAAGLAAIIIAIVVGVALSRGLSRPVTALVQATERVASGDYEAEVSVASRDELATLATAFNDMTRGLLLKEQYRSVLNKVVSREVAEELMEGGVELGGETRQITVLFADIRGFTALTEGMEPQGVIGFLNECMELLSEAVEAEGGVVDKYVGDELMAVFGAPVSHEDHALRAVSAAVRMMRALDELNGQRTARGEEPLGLGVGVSTGMAVAGNMGSKTRLNYTVLGEIVNLGSRLCSGAEAGEVLITGSTLEEAGSAVVATPMGARGFKGFSRDMEVFAVQDVSREGGEATEVPEADRAVDVSPPATQASRSAGLTATALLLASLAGLAVPGGVLAQTWPTLQDLGVEYISPSGSVQISFSGRLDLELLGFEGLTSGLSYGGGDNTLLAPRVRLFTDVFLGDNVYGLVELRGDRGPAPRAGESEVRVEQAFLRISESAGKISVQAGLFASPFGSYALRHLTEIDPFIRPPLAYDYRTVMSRDVAPMSPEAFLTWQADPAKHREGGAPPVWDVPYQWGAMVAGATGALTWRVAAMNSAPSSEPDAWDWDSDRMEHPSLVAGLGVRVLPSLTLGASWNRGPWLNDPELPAATGLYTKTRWDYDQELFALDATLARGPVTARAEWIHDRWEVPGLTYDPVDVGYSLEIQVDVAAGWSVAGRGGLLDFSTLRTAAGSTQDWDTDVARYEASLGYRFARNAGVLGAYSTTRAGSGPPLEEGLWALRLWWAF